MWEFPLFPEEASTIAGKVDAMFFTLLGLSIFFATLVSLVVIFFTIKYRRGSKADRSKLFFESSKLEFTWSFIPLVLAMTMFTWGAMVYFELYRPPVYAADIYIVGKQWMWKAQHPEGVSEINQLHVPINEPIRLIMTSQDVIHSFYIPAFRIKQDVLPGRYTSIWFEATKPGTYHLFCAEYCGTDHATMGGSVVVMTQADYEAWLGGEKTGLTMAQSGEALFQQMGCSACHLPDGKGKGPALTNIFEAEVQLTNGQTVTADENYLRESITNPLAKVVTGYTPIMPTFQGQISEEGVQQIVAYLKSLKAQ